DFLHAAHNLINLLLTFEADDHGVDAAQTEDEPEGGELLLFRLEGSFPEDLHAEDAFALLVHGLQAGNDFFGRAVHARLHANRIDASQIDFDPVTLDGRPQWIHTMARNPDGLDMSFFLGLGEHVHDRSEVRRPGAGRHAVHERTIDIIHAP